jgi:hypothetical protein
MKTIKTMKTKKITNDYIIEKNDNCTTTEQFIKDSLDNCLIEFGESKIIPGEFKISFLDKKSYPLFVLRGDKKRYKITIDFKLEHSLRQYFKLKKISSDEYGTSHIKSIIKVFNEVYGKRIGFTLSNTQKSIRENYYGGDYRTIIWNLPKKVQDTININVDKEENEKTISKMESFFI